MKNTRKCIVFLLVLSMLTTIVPTAKAQAAAKPKTTSASILHDRCLEVGKKILFELMRTKGYIRQAQLKLLTALTVLEYSGTDEEIKYTKKIRRMVPSDASALNLKTGRTYTVEQYLHMLLIVSDAGSAVALAQGTAGSQKDFVVWMNEKAKALGMMHSHFDNPIGLDKGSGYYGTYTTAADFIKVSKAAMENPVIKRIVAKHKYRVQPDWC